MSVFFDTINKIFYLDGKSVTYAFFVNDVGYLEHLYFGTTVPHDDLRYARAKGTTTHNDPTPPGKDNTRAYIHYPPELTFFGISDYREPTVQICTQLGDRLSELLYIGHAILPNKPTIPGMPSMDGEETLMVTLRDAVTGFVAELYYTVYDDCDVIARHIVYMNAGQAPLSLQRAYSFAIGLPGQDYKVLSLYGGWARERTPERTPLPHGVITVDSKRASSSDSLNPFIALLSPDATETAGEAYGFSLVYSSSYVLKAEGVSTGETIVTGGIQDFDFAWKLEPGERLATPEIVIAYSDAGIGGMSRAYHDAYRNHLINSRFVTAPRPLLINNWEGTYFNFTTEKLKAIVDAVEGTGIDTFVLDDGWFGKRDSDRSGLGDWFVNEQKLAGGIKPLVDYVHGKGMKFGLWFEPEMVSENSDLFRAHPDYAIGVPRRPRCYARHQYMLDLTRKEVRDYIVNAVNTVITENGIDYVKWDYNRNVTEFFSLGLASEDQSRFAHLYALGLYELCERIVEVNPHVFFEGCSGGGARFDPAMLHYFPQIWTSDDTDAEERTKIQYGTSIVYPLSAMSCHVSICPNHQTGRSTSFKTRGDIAHLGATGYELDTTKLTEDERHEVAAQVQEYNACRDLILCGDLYRIDDPFTSNFFSEAIVSKDKCEAVLICYRRMGGVNNAIKRVRMAGLDPAKQYYVRELNMTLSGQTLMRVGIVPAFAKGDFATVKYHFSAL